MSITINEAEMMGQGKMVYDYTQYGHDNHVNVITEEAFKHLVTDTFKVITDVLRETYGPYGSTIMISENNETTATKDGYNIYNALYFGHQYKKMVYLAIKKIIERVNNNVGDGTTSCILLAEKIFNRINEIVKTSEDKRNVQNVLNFIENNLQSSTELAIDRNDGNMIKPLTEESLSALLMVAANYDTELVDHLMDALQPVCKEPNDPRTPIVSMNNVIVDSAGKYEASSTTYKTQILPGDYRVRINMDPRFALALDRPSTMRVILYDHTFAESEWDAIETAFGKNNDEPIMIIARTFSAVFMNNTFVRHCKRRELAGLPTPYRLVEIVSGYFQDEIHDLAAVLGTKAHTVHDLAIDKDEVPFAKLSVFNYDCLAFYDLTSPDEYTELLRIAYSHEKSYAKRTLLNDRINALEMKTKDSIISVTAESTLEQKLLSDKLDDCVAIAKSALEYGVVPNMLRYGFKRTFRVFFNNEDEDSLEWKITQAICDSIEDLADDIWKSKYKSPTEESKEKWIRQQRAYFYHTEKLEQSYDIITDALLPTEELPTSAQYDMEILIASISIVKYILSARALIFDAHLVQPQGDDGHFQFMGD